MEFVFVGIGMYVFFGGLGLDCFKELNSFFIWYVCQEGVGGSLFMVIGVDVQLLIFFIRDNVVGFDDIICLFEVCFDFFCLEYIVNFFEIIKEGIDV